MNSRPCSVSASPLCEIGSKGDDGRKGRRASFSKLWPSILKLFGIPSIRERREQQEKDVNHPWQDKIRSGKFLRVLETKVGKDISAAPAYRDGGGLSCPVSLSFSHCW